MSQHGGVVARPQPQQRMRRQTLAKPADQFAFHRSWFSVVSHQLSVGELRTETPNMAEIPNSLKSVHPAGSAQACADYVVIAAWSAGSGDGSQDRTRRVRTTLLSLGRFGGGQWQIAVERFVAAEDEELHRIQVLEVGPLEDVGDVV